MRKNWRQRAYQPGDEESIFSLVTAVWGNEVPDKERWLKGWQQVYMENPAGSSIIWLAEADGKLVGQYPLVLMDMKIGDTMVKAGEVVDTMTHPDYRRQGIASALGKEALSQLKEQGACLAFGFPTSEVYPVHMKSGWLDVCAFQVLVKPLNLGNILKARFTSNRLSLPIFMLAGSLVLKTFYRAKRPPKIKGLTISRLSRFDERFDEFWNQICTDHSIILVRNTRFLNWRYVDPPDIDCAIYVAEDKHICGYMILGSHKERNGLTLGRIYDIVAPLDRPDVLHCLVFKATEHFQKEKVDAIFVQMIAHKIYRESFLKNGFVPHPRSKNRFIAYNVSANLHDEFLENPANWFIQLGDLPGVY
ncbi:GNAT family N-acetyltransferase [Chloroflexota bacterium]